MQPYLDRIERFIETVNFWQITKDKQQLFEIEIFFILHRKYLQ